MQIKTYDDIQLMTGQGEEWLLNRLGFPVMIFFDGNLRKDGSGHDDVTLTNYCDA